MKKNSKNLFRKEAGFVLVLLFSFFSLFSCAGAVTTEGGGTTQVDKNYELTPNFRTV